MSVEMQVPKDAPVMQSWEAYKISDSYPNTFKWAADEQHREGSLWSAFYNGFMSGVIRSDSLERESDAMARAEAAEARVKALEEALRPFAEVYKRQLKTYGEAYLSGETHVKYSDLRRASETLKG